ncbi:WXG100 family type VII secretion target [Prauserella rugosa]|uniref:Uncharacterized protein n=1 Tax=Prauserella rugosa TaxID=43354 RepID=A0A660CDS8_9PSEU|nr:hypothetical protein [Prauserella rugosa]KMS68167.1 hypothetical protein ACZ91_67025 [Streptomyces regensis]TWH21552.1 hypothetical protein JD82_03417 [Prauserella rugosa]
MPIDTEIKADAASIRRVAEWLSKRSEDAHQTCSQVYGARGDSEGTWTGPASDGFRTTMTAFGKQINGLGEDLTETSSKLGSHADDVQTAKSRMSQALEIARKGGLTVNGNVIEEPGPAPAAPAPLPTDRKPSPRQQQIHDQATSAQSAHEQKVKAYVEAERTATPAREAFVKSQQTFVRFAKGYAEKAPINIADISTGLAGAVAQRTSNYRAAARAMDPAIDRAAAYAKSGRTNPYAQARADALEIERRLAKQAELNKATATRTARMVDKLPKGVKDTLRTNLDFGKYAPDKPPSNPLLRGATKFGSKLPVIGGVVTGLGVSWDIASGKDPGTAVASGAGSFVAGSLTTAAVASAGGPVGWAVAGGAIVSAGVGFAIDEWGDDMAEVAGDAAGWAGDKLSDGAKAVGNFVSDLF